MTPHKRFYVDIGPVVGKSDKIWTLTMNDESTKVPLVLLHGMAAGLALWCPNLDALAAARPVYAIDLLGFGRSSRPKFATDAVKVEAQWVESLEAWRRELNLSQFVLLGHSLGGYIATAYTLRYPERVRHLIVADPWGFNVRTAADDERYAKIPLWKRAVITSMDLLNPLWAVRAAGPAGRWLVSKTRPDISRKYLKYLHDAETVIPEYIYQCNSQTPSGETAFHTLGEMFIFAKQPMVTRLDQLHPAIPITDIYGAKSWVPCSSDLVREKRPSSTLYTKVIEDASHHIYLDNSDAFNEIVIEACAKADEYDPQIKPIQTNGKAGDDSGTAESQSQANTSGQLQNSNGNVAKIGNQSQKGIAISDQSQPAVTLLNQHENTVAVQ